MSTVNTGHKAPSGVNTAPWLRPVTGIFDKEADAMRKTILEAPDCVEVDGDKWYVSELSGDDNNDGRTPETAWKTLQAVVDHFDAFQKGDAVLFERGGVYRGHFLTKPYVYYGAYGTGDKPCLYGSPFNLAKVEWEKTDMPNIWRYGGYTRDVGQMVFDYGKAVGVKKMYKIDDVRQNFDFFYEDGYVYLYMDKGDPATLYESIEAGEKYSVIDLPSGTEGHVTIDNLCVKHAGAHGISGADLKNCVIKNCEIGWIGGSILGKYCRYGNGIEYWAACDNMVVENCWIYQCYDTGWTFQTSSGGAERNIKFNNNLVEYCWYSTEMWNHHGDDNTIENVQMDGNIMRFAGYGWGDQRYDPVNSSHIFTGAKQAKNFTVTNNIFEGGIQSLAFAYGAEFDSNTYVQHYNTNYRSLGIDREGKQLPFDENAEQRIRDSWGDQNPIVIYAEI